MSYATILLADDEPDIHTLLTPMLEREGYAVTHARTGPESVTLARQGAPDLLLLDVMLPGMDGMEVCRELRRTDTYPILFLSARGEEVDKLLGLGVGGDDYITKPFSATEVVARVKAHLRRRRQFDAPAASGPEAAPILHAAGLQIDPGAAEVRLPNGSAVVLTAKELGLLMALASFFVTSGVGIVATLAGVIIFQSKYQLLYPISGNLMLVNRLLGDPVHPLVLGSIPLSVSIQVVALAVGAFLSLLYVQKADYR